MDPQFWIKAWQEGRTAFHRSEYNELMLKHFLELEPKAGEKIFVPLCGKTKDMLWLRSLGLQVDGVELYTEAVQAFYAENGLPAPKVQKQSDFTVYSSEQIEIRCGDFFKVNEIETYDLVYDRGSLVALPPNLRKLYANIIKKSMKPGGRDLLLAYEYDPSELEGPPFSVTESEIRELFGDQFKITLLERERPSQEGQRLQSADSLVHTVYRLDKF